MFKLMPKVPACLLVGVLAWVWWVQHDAQRAESIADIRLESQPIPLVSASQGSWTLDWSTWDPKKGEPFVVAPGWLVNQPNAPRILIRVEPRDSVRLGHLQTADAEGWFQAGHSTDGSTCAILDPTRAAVIEYRVVNLDQRSERVVQLSVQGWKDGLIREGTIVGKALGTALGAFLGLCVGVWLFAQWISRVRRSRAESGMPQSGT